MMVVERKRQVEEEKMGAEVEQAADEAGDQ